MRPRNKRGRDHPVRWRDNLHSYITHTCVRGSFRREENASYHMISVFFIMTHPAADTLSRLDNNTPPPCGLWGYVDTLLT